MLNIILFLVIIAPNVSHLLEYPTITPHPSQYYSEGYVVFNEEGRLGKLCVGNQNESSIALNAVVSSLCNALTYKYVALFLH